MKTVHVATIDGRFAVRVESVKGYLVHKELGKDSVPTKRWSVTHAGTGYQASFRTYPTRQMACNYARQFAEAFPDFDDLVIYDKKRSAYSVKPEALPALRSFVKQFDS